MNQPQVTITNGVVSMAKDLVFGWTVLSSDHGWYPVSDLNKDDARVVLRSMDGSRLFPEDAYQAVRTQLSK